MTRTAKKHPAQSIESYLATPMVITNDIPGFKTPAKEQLPTASANPEKPAMEAVTAQLQLLTAQLQAVEAAQSAFSTRFDRLETQLREDTRASVIEILAIRKELLGERKALSALSVVNGIVPALDSLYAMQKMLEKDPTSPALPQIDAIIHTLVMMLRGLGFEEFIVDVNAPFNPGSMEFAGYAPGPGGVVLGVVRKGYRTQSGVVRPVGVLIANPYLKNE